MNQNSKTRRNFIFRNEGFKCKKCGFLSPSLKGSCRNHCCRCLYSLHVDLSVPGDRESDCGGLMEPSSLDYKSKKGYVIVHRCLECGVLKRNKISKDDNLSTITRLGQGKTLA